MPRIPAATCRPRAEPISHLNRNTELRRLRDASANGKTGTQKQNETEMSYDTSTYDVLMSSYGPMI